MRLDTLSVSVTSHLIELALPLFLIRQVLLVPVHHGVVLISTISNLIGEFAVLVGDSDLLLQADLFIVKFTKTVLQHLGLELDITESLVENCSTLD